MQFQLVGYALPGQFRRFIGDLRKRNWSEASQPAKKAKRRKRREESKREKQDVRARRLSIDIPLGMCPLRLYC